MHLGAAQLKAVRLDLMHLGAAQLKAVQLRAVQFTFVILIIVSTTSVAGQIAQGGHNTTPQHH
jgi:hypothetical protein